ncbi:TRAP transporter small permease subunit [Chelatococcus asaccharovorans]|nr:TRAP transporter small permease subunit [Chelatococcus asaccharovorans]MBS7706325.1 TRAP transporter small permease subunit [Chelatococcus asaccharovorans]
MMDRLRTLGGWLARRAENVLVLMLGAMFAVFILQVVFRYMLNLPIGWTHEISVILWLWIVLFGSAFVTRESEEIRFDIIYGAVGRRARRVMAVVTAAALVVLYTISLPAMADYVSFMKVERTAYLKLPFNWVYAIYLAFAVASIARYLWLGWRAMRGNAPEAFDPTKAGSGV